YYRKTGWEIINLCFFQAFSHYGKIKKCHLVKNIVTGISRGYAFIEYYHKSDAYNAYLGANRKEIDGRRIFVDKELERVLHGWIPRRLGGGLGGKKESGQLRFGGRDRHFKMPYIAVKESSSHVDKAEGKHEDRFRPQQGKFRMQGHTDKITEISCGQGSSKRNFREK
ncbi:hypothetical protein J437_LFUL003516, partial [Ladona fulva]